MCVYVCVCDCVCARACRWCIPAYVCACARVYVMCVYVCGMRACECVVSVLYMHVRACCVHEFCVCMCIIRMLGVLHSLSAYQLMRLAKWVLCINLYSIKIKSICRYT